MERSTAHKFNYFILLKQLFNATFRFIFLLRLQNILNANFWKLNAIHYAYEPNQKAVLLDRPNFPLPKALNFNFISPKE
jgi:hypothetical protein